MSSTTSETKKLVTGVGNSLESLAKALDTSKTQFEDARSRAERVVQGSATDVEQQLVGKLKQGSEHAETAREAVKKAIAACQSYANTTI